VLEAVMTAPIQPGERAPAFSLPAINREGVGSAADYRGRALDRLRQWQ
jgi:hypothetical protein